MFTISAACTVDDSPFTTFFEPSKQTFTFAEIKVELSLCLSRRSWLHLLTLISHCPAASPIHNSRGGQNQNNDAVCA